MHVHEHVYICIFYIRPHVQGGEGAREREREIEMKSFFLQGCDMLGLRV